MSIRLATAADLPRIQPLTQALADLHQTDRPDIFRATADPQTLAMTPSQPIFVATDQTAAITGYAACHILERTDHATLSPYRLLYLDALYVAPRARGNGIGGRLLERCEAYGREAHCSRLGLNVWEYPGSALAFYERHGLKTQRRRLETPLI